MLPTDPLLFFVLSSFINGKWVGMLPGYKIPTFPRLLNTNMSIPGVCFSSTILH